MLIILFESKFYLQQNSQHMGTYGMGRKNTSTDIDMALGFISNELLTSSSHIKRCIMHQHLCASNIVADKKTVRITLKLLNLEGVVLR